MGDERRECGVGAVVSLPCGNAVSFSTDSLALFPQTSRIVITVNNKLQQQTGKCRRSLSAGGKTEMEHDAGCIIVHTAPLH